MMKASICLCPLNRILVCGHGSATMPKFMPGIVIRLGRNRPSNGGVVSIVSENAFGELLSDLDCYRDLDRTVLLTWFAMLYRASFTLNWVPPFLRGTGCSNGKLCWSHSINNESKLLPESDYRTLNHGRIRCGVALSIRVSSALKVKVHFVPTLYKDLMNVGLLRVVILFLFTFVSCNCRHKKKLHLYKINRCQG